MKYNNLHDELDYGTVQNNLLDMGNIDRYATGEEMSEYYYLYEENCIWISTAAYDLHMKICDGPSSSYESREWMYKYFRCDNAEAWNTAIASMEWLDHNTLCNITGGNREIYSAWEDGCVAKEYQAKLQRMTKASLMELMSWVTGSLMQYMEVRAAYDAIYSILSELESNNSMLKDGDGFHEPESAHA